MYYADQETEERKGRDYNIPYKIVPSMSSVPPTMPHSKKGLPPLTNNATCWRLSFLKYFLIFTISFIPTREKHYFNIWILIAFFKIKYILVIFFPTTPQVLSDLLPIHPTLSSFSTKIPRQ